MAGRDMSDEALVGFLREHPELRERVVSIAAAVENADGDLKEADAAEERLVEEMRDFGRAALQSWADRRVEATEREMRQDPLVRHQGKKKSAGIRSSAT